MFVKHWLLRRPRHRHEASRTVHWSIVNARASAAPKLQLCWSGAVVRIPAGDAVADDQRAWVDCSARAGARRAGRGSRINGYECAHVDHGRSSDRDGLVKLGERRRSVDRSLGKGRLKHGGTDSGSYRYHSGAITFEATYDLAEHVNEVNTTSGAALIFGRRLSEGLARETQGDLSCSSLEDPQLPRTDVHVHRARRTGHRDRVALRAPEGRADRRRGSIGEACLPI